MSAFDDAAARQLAGGVVRPGVYLYIDATTGPIRIATVFGDRRIAADAVDLTGGIYTGIGALGGLPAVNQLVNGVASRVEYSVSGVDEEWLARVDADADTIRGAKCFQAFVAFDENWQPLFDPLWLTEMTIDVLRANFDGSSSVLSLSASTANINRRRPPLDRFTGADQRTRFADDAFCDRTSIYAQNTTVRWPS